MSLEHQVTNRVRECRIARGWSQDELAARAGISRDGVSAIETGRLGACHFGSPGPSGRLMECRVEDLFQLASVAVAEATWAWPPTRGIVPLLASHHRRARTDLSP